ISRVLQRPALAEREGRLDQGEVRERLGEVAELAQGDGVVLLGEEAEVVAKVEQALEQLARFVVPALQREDGSEPEGTGQEHTLVSRQSVHAGLLGSV